MKLYYHKTDGGAEYLTDTYIVAPNGTREGTFKGAKFVVRIDGDIEKDAELRVANVRRPRLKIDDAWSAVEAWMDRFVRKFGGWWGEHPEYSVTDWRHEVRNETTRLGYWDWVLSSLEADRCAKARKKKEAGHD